MSLQFKVLFSCVKLVDNIILNRPQASERNQMVSSSYCPDLTVFFLLSCGAVGGKWHLFLLLTCLPLAAWWHPPSNTAILFRQSCELPPSQPSNEKLCVFLFSCGSSDPALSNPHPPSSISSVFGGAPPPPQTSWNSSLSDWLRK